MPLAQEGRQFAARFFSSRCSSPWKQLSGPQISTAVNARRKVEKAIGLIQSRARWMISWLLPALVAHPSVGGDCFLEFGEKYLDGVFNHDARRFRMGLDRCL